MRGSPHLFAPARSSAPPSLRPVAFLRENTTRERSFGPFCRDPTVAIVLTARVRHTRYQAPTRPGASTKPAGRVWRQDARQTRNKARTRRRRVRSCAQLSWGARARCELDKTSRPICYHYAPGKCGAVQPPTGPPAAPGHGADPGVCLLTYTPHSRCAEVNGTRTQCRHADTSCACVCAGLRSQPSRPASSSSPTSAPQDRRPL